MKCNEWAPTGWTSPTSRPPSPNKRLRISGSAGVGVTNLAALRATDSEYLQRFLEIYSATREGWPDPDPAPSPTPIDIDELRSWLDDSRLPEAFFIATLQQRYVAFSSFFGIGTAVHPVFRRQGIATLLKAGSLADAQRRGFQGQTTSTASRGSTCP